MTPPGPTLGTLFAHDGTSDLESDAVREAVRARLSLDAPAVSWPLVRDQVSEKLSAAFDTTLSEVFITTWNKYEALQRYRDRERFPPEEVYLVALAKHTIRSQHRPYLEILVGEATVTKAVFDVSLALEIEGFRLEIQDATIRSIKTGALSGEATLSLAGATLLEKKLDRIVLPGSLDLGAGVAIG